MFPVLYIDYVDCVDFFVYIYVPCCVYFSFLFYCDSLVSCLVLSSFTSCVFPPLLITLPLLMCSTCCITCSLFARYLLYLASVFPLSCVRLLCPLVCFSLCVAFSLRSLCSCFFDILFFCLIFILDFVFACLSLYSLGLFLHFWHFWIPFCICLGFSVINVMIRTKRTQMQRPVLRDPPVKH